MNRVSRTALAAAICTALSAGTAHSATFNVTNTNDDGAGSLRQALIDANANGEADTVNLSAISGQTITLSSGQLLIAYDEITIDGASVTVDAAGTSRVLYAYESEVTINDLTITGGLAGTTPVRGPGGPPVGGGLLAKYSDLILNDSVVTGNEAEDAGGVAVLAYGYQNVEFNDSVISGNTAASAAGGALVYLYGGDVAVSGSTISGNQVTGSGMSPRLSDPDFLARPFGARIAESVQSRGKGGGSAGGSLLISGIGNLNIVQSTFSENTSAGSAGGLIAAAFYGDLTVTESTIANNTAQVDSGGAVLESKYEVELSNSTVSGNVASTGAGGGVVVLSGYDGQDRGSATTRIAFTTIVGNSAATEAGGLYVDSDLGPHSIIGSVISGNLAPTDPDLAIGVDGFGVVDMEWSLIGIDPSTGTLNKDATSTTLTGFDPQIATLADNGGPTETHQLLIGSPLLDQVPNASGGCGLEFTNDQRGETRPQNGACDIGSVEGFGAGLPESLPVPVLDRIGLLLMGGLLGLAGLFSLRRRRRSQT